MGNRVPHQREITIKKAVCDKQHLYAAINLKALNEAAKRLQGKASFKLYIYFSKNAEGYKFNLSSKDFMEWSGVAETAYRSAFAELVKEGYLVKTDEKENYVFYDDRCALGEKM